MEDTHKRPFWAIEQHDVVQTVESHAFVPAAPAARGLMRPLCMPHANGVLPGELVPCAMAKGVKRCGKCYLAVRSLK